MFITIRFITLNIIQAIAYFLGSYLGMMLAIPPGNVSPIWPGAGIALAGLLVYGKRVAPGIFIGALAAQIYSYIDHSTTDKIIDSLLIGGIISIGSCAQAIVGAMLIQHFIGRNDPLILEKKIIRFLLLGGPVSCIIAATIGVSTIFLKGIICSADYPISWGTWWVGDTIGVVVFTPLTLIFISSPKNIWRKRRNHVAYPIIIMLALVIMMFRFTNQQELNHITAEFERQTILFHGALHNKIQSHIELNHTLKSFFDSSNNISKESFIQFTRSLLLQNKCLQALEWIPRVSHRQRTIYETTENITIRDPDANRQMHPAGIRPEYFPITYLEPFNNNEKALGYDISNNADAFKAIQLARDSGKTVVTGRIQLIQDMEKKAGFVIYSPVYAKNRPLSTVAEKRAFLQGFVASVLRTGDIVREVKRHLPKIQLLIKIHNNEALLFSNFPDQTQHKLDIVSLQKNIDINVANQRWSIIYRPSMEFINAQLSWNVWWLFFSGLVFTGLTGTGLLMLTGRALRTEELVEIRTRELRQTNKKLSDNEAHYRELVQAQSAIVWRANPNTFQFTFVNDEAKKILGYPVTDWLEEEDFWINHLHEEDRNWASAFCREKIKQFCSYEFEYRMYTQQGEIVWLKDIVNIIVENGKAKELVGVMIDVTKHRNAENALKLSESKYRILFENDMDAMLILDLESLFFIDANAKALILYGIQQRDLNHIGPLDLSPKLQPSGKSSREAAKKYITEALYGGETTFEWLHINTAGKKMICTISLTPMPSLGRKLVKASVRDITEQKKMEEHLRLAATTFETHEGILITDRDSKILRVNKAFTEITGYTSQEVIGKNPRILKSGRHNKSFYQNLWRQLIENGKFEGEIWNRRKNGEIFPEWQTITAVKNKLNETTHFVAIFSDITEKKKTENEIYELAFYDPLTSLPNRRLFLSQLASEMIVAKRQNYFGTILFLDLDRFKILNDSMGHHVGDELLIQVAERLKQTLRKADIPARLSGDEFVIMLHANEQSLEQATKKAKIVAKKVLDNLNQPFFVRNYEHHCSASIGVALFPEKGISANEVLQQADKAMYRSKARGRNTISFFHRSMQLAANARLFLEKDLRQAIANNDFVLYYQPQTDKEGALSSAEALIRWNHKKKGVIPPADFIPVAEETGLIIPIGQWVLNEACKQMRSWQDQGINPAHISINVSSRQFRQENFVSEIKKALATHHIKASQLLIELTEGVVIDNIQNTVKKMHALKEVGVKISIDDFGTGYSSLAYLKQLPLNQLKIDRSFIRDVCTDANDATIVETIIAMAHNLDLEVVAEGVENKEQMQFLCAKGCSFFQGYYFSPPLPAEKFIKFF